MDKERSLCLDCGKPISVGSARCRSCANRARNPRVEVPCDYCGTILLRKPSRVSRSEYNFCNITCRSRWRSKHLTGDSHWSWKGGPVEYECAWCGQPFQRKQYSAQRFCSVECKGNAQSQWQAIEKNPNVTCAHCGIPMYRTASDLSRSSTFFCSVECHGAWQSEHWNGENHPRFNEETYMDLTCACCGARFTRAIHAIRGKELSFCGQECMHQWQSENWTGENGPNWKGGVSFDPYSVDFNLSLKKSIRKRDRRRCQLCGEKGRRGKRLSVHHIDYDKANNDPGNLISLCRSCHGRTGGNRSYWQCLFTELLACHSCSSS